MTQDNLNIQFYRFIFHESPLEKIKALFEALMESKALIIEEEPVGSFRLPAIIYHAILSEMVRRAKPKDEADLTESEFLQRFL
jgi:hypothetical protein